MDIFEKLENDVYTDGCKGIQPFEQKQVLGTGNQIMNGNKGFEDVSKKDSSFSSDVHILILEESNIPDLESVNESKTVTSQSSDFDWNKFEDKETVLIEDYSEQAGFINIDNQEILNIEDVENYIEDNKSKDISPEI